MAGRKAGARLVERDVRERAKEGGRYTVNVKKERPLSTLARLLFTRVSRHKTQLFFVYGGLFIIIEDGHRLISHVLRAKPTQRSHQMDSTVGIQNDGTLTTNRCN